MRDKGERDFASSVKIKERKKKEKKESGLYAAGCLVSLFLFASCASLAARAVCGAAQ